MKTTFITKYIQFNKFIIEFSYIQLINIELFMSYLLADTAHFYDQADMLICRHLLKIDLTKIITMTRLLTLHGRQFKVALKTSRKSYLS